SARAEEIAGLQWSEIGADSINLPGSRTKNRRAHTIPLSEPARAIIAGIVRGKRTHVFGRDDSGFYGWAKCKVRLGPKLGDEVAHWTTHDLRRSAVTHMAELGVQPHIIEAVINHASGHKGGVAGIYNRAAHDKEKRAALALWAEHVVALVEDRKAVVVPLRREVICANVKPGGGASPGREDRRKLFLSRGRGGARGTSTNHPKQTSQSNAFRGCDGKCQAWMIC